MVLGAKLKGKFILTMGLWENFLEKVIIESILKGDSVFKIPRKVYRKAYKYRLRRTGI